MSEEAWRCETDPDSLLRLALMRASARKSRLFACSCVRLMLPHLDGLPDPVPALDMAERISDQQSVDWDERRATYGQLDNYETRSWFEGGHVLTLLVLIDDDPIRAAEVALSFPSPFLHSAGRPVGEWQLALIQEVFGNPFRPIDFAPWRTDTAVALARQMYEWRDFGAMPILADALQDAGCDNTDVLNHCRDANQTHVRGCWVVDGVLGKE